MMALLLRGKEVADALTEQLTNQVKELKEKDIHPQLTIVRVGTNPSDLAYERGAKTKCSKIGIEVTVLELEETIEQEQLIKHLEQLNQDHTVSGILVFRPLPKHMNESVVQTHIAPKKDVDCFYQPMAPYPPCTPAAVMEILKYYKIIIQGKKAVVIGRSMVIGQPVAKMLLDANATVTICHSKTALLHGEAAQADILIGAIGKAKLINHRYVKRNAVIIDVGINQDEKGELCGDVDFDDVVARVGAITPVPGGVGSVTTTVLAKHVILASQQ